MIEKFREIRLSKKNKEKLDAVNSIIAEYSEDGYTLTLRQLYYQLVSRDMIPNQDREYNKLSRLLKEGRMGGIVDWDAIEDRLRQPYLPYYYDSPQEAIEDTINQYRLDRQMGQDTYLEVWVEKDALSGVLRRITSRYHVRLLVNRGYGSVTAIYDLYQRSWRQIAEGKDVKILYLGDHDPSGIDMIRDVTDRTTEMLASGDLESSFTLEPIALTMEQIRMYDPPPNPAKLSDTRARAYLDEFGPVSWEVDALPPNVLNDLLSSKIEENIDMDQYYAMLEQEKKDKEKLRKFIN